MRVLALIEAPEIVQNDDVELFNESFFDDDGSGRV